MASAKNNVDTDPDCAAGKGTAFTPNDVFGCAAFFGGQGAANKTGAACCAKVNRNFAYDDVAEQSGFLGCNKSTEMDITYCPGDPQWPGAALSLRL